MPFEIRTASIEPYEALDRVHHDKIYDNSFLEMKMQSLFDRTPAPVRIDGGHPAQEGGQSAHQVSELLGRLPHLWRWPSVASTIAGAVLVAALYASPAAAGSLYGVYNDKDLGYPAVLAGIDSTTGNVTSSAVIGQYFGGGAVAPLQYALSGLTSGGGQLYGVYANTDIGYPAVLANINPATGNVTSSTIIGQHFGGGSVAPLQYTLSGLAFGSGQLYGVYANTDIGYPAVLASINPGTGDVTASAIIGNYFGGGSVAPLQYTLSGLAFGSGHLYGVYANTDIGYPAVLADINPATGNIISSAIIGQYFGGGSVAPLQYSLSGLTYEGGNLYGVYANTDLGYPAVLARINPETGDVTSSAIIGNYFGGGSVAPLQYALTGLAGGITPVPLPASLALFAMGLLLTGLARSVKAQTWSAT